MKASKMAFLTALSDIDPKYLKEFRRFLKPEPKWRIIMKKSMSFTAKAVTVAVAAVVLLGIAFLPGLFQNNITQAAAPTEEKPLRICFDMGTKWDDSGTVQENYVQHLVNDFCFYNAHREEGSVGYGLTEDMIEIECIPGGDAMEAERVSALKKIRTEIMAGQGPDVFICLTNGLIEDLEVEGSRLFPYVEFSMEDDLFLPLDDLIAEFEYTDPAQLTQVLMDGGKNKAGEQVLLPFRYTIPMLYFEREDLEPVDQSGKTWNDVLTSDDPLLKEQVRWAWPVWWGFEEFNRHDYHDSALPYIFPSILDTENRGLAFTEDDLFARVQESLPVMQELMQEDSEIVNDAWYFVRPGATGGRVLNRDHSVIDRPTTLIPLRNETGGVTALIHSYGAINANTPFAKEAALFLDFLSRTANQSDPVSAGVVNVFSGMLTGTGGMPVNAEARQPNGERMGGGERYTKETSDEWEKATQQIDTVHFPSAMDLLIKKMTREIGTELKESAPAVLDGPGMYPDGYANGTISEEKLREIVHETYKKMVELIGEA